MKAIQIRIIPDFTAIPNIAINNTFTLVMVQLAKQNNFDKLSELLHTVPYEQSKCNFDMYAFFICFDENITHRSSPKYE